MPRDVFQEALELGVEVVGATLERRLEEARGVLHLARLALSGGEKRRLSIARSLCTDPTLLMLDEPFSGVDPIAVMDIQRIITDLREEDNIALLITDHNVRETLQIVDRAYLILLLLLLLLFVFFLKR